MPYNIQPTDTSKPTVNIADGVVDTTSTSIPLVGKNHQGYGDEIATAFFRMLENFANNTAPNAPVDGQLWYDSNLKTLKVFVIDAENTAGDWRTILTENSSFIGDLIPDQDNVYNIGSDDYRWATVHAEVFKGTATKARYADLAERYEADAVLEAGDVVMIGGAKEVTKTTSAGSEDVFGVVSTSPGLCLNSGAGDDSTHPYIGLTGRVPVKVKGQVAKGQRLMSSDEAGVAMAWDGVSTLAILGRALEAKTSEEVEKIEAVVGA